MRHFRLEGRCPIAPSIILPHGYEADVAAVMEKSKYLTEYEIKCSIADFRADFKKSMRAFTTGDSNLKHDTLAHRKHGQSHPAKGKTGKKFWTPNYFYFVAEVGILPLKEIPEHAGLIELSWNKYWPLEVDIKVIKKAPLLHKDRVGGDEKVVQAFLRRLSNIAAYGSSHTPN